MRRRSNSGRAGTLQGIPGLLPPLALRIEFSRPRADVESVLKVRGEPGWISIGWTRRVKTNSPRRRLFDGAIMHTDDRATVTMKGRYTSPLARSQHSKNCILRSTHT
jgi:hypothetical protein